MAKFYGIGTGPGESTLLTIKGKERLETIDILYVPEAKKQGKSLALAIVEPYLPSDLEIRQRHFPMTNDFSEKESAWNKIAAEIIEEVQSGKDVGFVTLGDPMVYSTYSYLLDRVKESIETETIPGISSFCHISNHLQIPLVLDEETYSVVPATASKEFLANALDYFSTIVIMKVAVALPKVLEVLAERQLLEKTVLVSNSSLKNEQIHRNVNDLHPADKLSYFSTMIVYKNR